MSRLVLILGDQLSTGIRALREADKSRDVVVMAEVADEATYVRHHPKKIAFLYAAMRKFADKLETDGWRVRYSKIDEDATRGGICGELMRRAEEEDAGEVIATEPGEFRLISALEDCPVPVHLFEDDRFLCPHSRFEAWAKERSSLRMEYFYREMRRETGYLMDGDAPAGGKWNYDQQNRKPPPDGIDYGGPMHFTPDETVEEVLNVVEARFGSNFGAVRPFWFATDSAQARRHLAHWVKTALPQFGAYQDAMIAGERFLYHSVLSLYMNAGLLEPREVCAAAVEAHAKGDAPLNAVEGFVRQIIGWREYMRGIYFLKGPDYVRQNALGQSRALPPMFWGEPTAMRCISETVAQTRDEAYAHHIQRLMITGNFALLAGIDPAEVHDWYMSVYADAYEWVMAGNTIGMTQFADGGLVASKPYVSSGNYIDKMSDYCGGCAYDVKQKTGEGACPYNLLYWDFLARHRPRFEGNPRMAQMYATWDRMNEDKRDRIRKDAADWLGRMERGEPV